MHQAALVYSAKPYRSPLSIGRLAFPLRMLAGAENIKSRGWRRLAGKAAKFWFRRVYCALKAKAAGEIVLTSPAGEKKLPFNGKNSHFGCLYMPRFKGGYEASSLALLAILVKENSCFLDIGANFGFFSLSLAARPGFNGQIHAFEPFLPSFNDLCLLTKGFGLEAIISPYNLALSSQDGNACLRFDGVHSALARLYRNVPGKGVLVKTARLDSLGLRPDVIKIDVEGHEAEVLQGGESIIRERRPAILFETLHLDSPLSTLKPFHLLHRLGYVFYLPVWRAEEAGQYYFLAGLPSAAAAAKLSLIPYRPEERLLTSGDCNVLAWPRERLGELERLFI